MSSQPSSLDFDTQFQWQPSAILYHKGTSGETSRVSFGGNITNTNRPPPPTSGSFCPDMYCTSYLRVVGCTP